MKRTAEANRQEARVIRLRFDSPGLDPPFLNEHLKQKISGFYLPFAFLLLPFYLLD